MTRGTILVILSRHLFSVNVTASEVAPRWSHHLTLSPPHRSPHPAPWPGLLCLSFLHLCSQMLWHLGPADPGETPPHQGWLVPRHSQQLTCWPFPGKPVEHFLSAPLPRLRARLSHNPPCPTHAGTRYQVTQETPSSPQPSYIIHIALPRLLSLPGLPFPEKWPSGSWPCFPLSRSASWKTLGVPMWPGHRMTGCVSCF